MRIFICSPYGGRVKHNVEVACKMARLAFACGHTPLIPHLMYPGVLRDDGSERDRAIGAGIEWLNMCRCIWMLCRDKEGPSAGMLVELEYNRRHIQLPVYAFPEGLLRPWHPSTKSRVITNHFYLPGNPLPSQNSMVLAPSGMTGWWVKDKAP